MLRLAKYLKPFIVIILIAVALLFAQAMADLTLPDYMGRIVNVGIQQGGVENAVPVALRASEMDKLNLFLSTDDQATVQAAYTLVDQNSADYNQYLSQYPVLANEPIYVLNDTGTAEIDTLNPIMGKAFLAVTGIEQIMADPSKAAAMGTTSGFDLSSLPAGTDLFALLKSMPAVLRTPILNAMNQRFDAMDPSLITQSAVGAVKTEYAALGMDTASLQNNYILSTGLDMLLLSLISVTCTILRQPAVRARSRQAQRATCAATCSRRSSASPTPNSTSSRWRR